MAKKETKKAAAPVKKEADAAKLEKRKARMEALKNRPAEQRSNSKQVDVIDLGNGNVVKNYGYPVKNKEGHVGVIVTSVVLKNDEVVSTSVTFVPGNLTVKAKKNHGTICQPKSKKEAAEDTDDDNED